MVWGDLVLLFCLKASEFSSWPWSLYISMLCRNAILKRSPFHLAYLENLIKESSLIKSSAQEFQPTTSNDKKNDIYSHGCCELGRGGTFYDSTISEHQYVCILTLPWLITDVKQTFRWTRTIVHKILLLLPKNASGLQNFGKCFAFHLQYIDLFCDLADGPK